MKPINFTSKKLFSAFSLVAAFFSISTKAMASDPYLMTPENASQLGLNFKNAENVLQDAGLTLSRQEIGIRFHEESNEVDLSSLDGVSVVVDLSRVSMPDSNEKIGGQ